MIIPHIREYISKNPKNINAQIGFINTLFQIGFLSENIKNIEQSIKVISSLRKNQNQEVKTIQDYEFQKLIEKYERLKNKKEK